MSNQMRLNCYLVRSPLAKSAKSNQTDFEILRFFLPTVFTNFIVLVKFKPYSLTNYNTYAENDTFLNRFEIYMLKFWTWLDLKMYTGLTLF